MRLCKAPCRPLTVPSGHYKVIRFELDSVFSHDKQSWISGASVFDLALLLKERYGMLDIASPFLAHNQFRIHSLWIGDRGYDFLCTHPEFPPIHAFLGLEGYHYNVIPVELFSVWDTTEEEEDADDAETAP